MAALFGAIATMASNERMIREEMMAVYRLLKDSGGMLNLERASELLSMSQDEIRQRIIDRSILGLVVHLDVYVPAFQFIGCNHIKSFHDIWDVFHGNFSPIEVCQFFVKGTVGEGGPYVYEALQHDASKELMDIIMTKARNHRKIVA